MNIAPLSTENPWYSHVFNHRNASVRALRAVPVEATVMMEQISFLHSGPETHYRPFLHLHGRLHAVLAPDVELPYSITEMEYPEGQGPLVNAFYHFDNEQLARLVAKGYFEEGFTVPSAMVGTPWVLPGTARLLFVAPEAMDEPPVVFLSLDDADSLRYDERSSGYELTEYFPNHAAQLAATHAAQQQAALEAGPVAVAAYATPDLPDLFAEGPQLVPAPLESTPVHALPGSVFTRLIDPERAQAEEQTAPVEVDAVEQLYEENIARRLAEAQLPLAAVLADSETITQMAPDAPTPAPVEAGSELEANEEHLAQAAPSDTVHGYPVFGDEFLVFEPSGDLDFDDSDGELAFAYDIEAWRAGREIIPDTPVLMPVPSVEHAAMIVFPGASDVQHEAPGNPVSPEQPVSPEGARPAEVTEIGLRRDRTARIAALQSEHEEMIAREAARAARQANVQTEGNHADVDPVPQARDEREGGSNDLELGL